MGFVSQKMVSNMIPTRNSPQHSLKKVRFKFSYSRIRHKTDDYNMGNVIPT